MANVKIRQGGQIVETDDANLNDAAKLAGQSVAPTDPSGAAAIGVNPDVAKMAGTPAQTAPVLETAATGAVPEGGKDLATAKRTDGPREDASSAETAAAERAAKMLSLIHI